MAAAPSSTPAAPRAASAWLSEFAQRLPASDPHLTTAFRAALPARAMDGPSPTDTKRLMDRIVHKADFERVLATRSRSRSTHFALHHLIGAPVPRVWQPKDAVHTELSTDPAPICPQPVDEAPFERTADLWFGCVVPKRHARRAVTRTLLKRQIRSAFQSWGATLPAGLWLVRLRAPFAKQDFISARSTLLAAAARTELEGLLTRAVV